MAKTASMATLKRIRACRLGQEVNRGRFPLLELLTVLCRSKNQPSGASRYSGIRNGCNFETMIVVDGCDLELNFGPDLHMNW